MQIGVAVAPNVPFSEKLLMNKLWIVAAVIALLAFEGWRALKRGGMKGAQVHTVIIS